jgi:hypothetical protein
MSTSGYKKVTVVNRTPKATGENDPVKETVRKALNVPTYLDKYWDVIDQYPAGSPQLALAHYNDEYDQYNRQHEPLRSVRGKIIDLETGYVVADSYGYTQTLTCYGPLTFEQSSDDSQGTINLETELVSYINSFELAPEEAPKITPGVRKFDQSTTRLFLGYEGAMVRIFKWNNQVFFSTHRKIVGTKSNWSGRTPFYDLFNKLGGPVPESLFGSETHSPFCYMFLIADDAVRIATSTRDNRVIFIGVKKLWNPEEKTVYFPNGLPEFNVWVPENTNQPDTFSKKLDRPMIIQPNVDVDTANKFMFPQKFAKDIPNTSYDAKDHELIVHYDNNGRSVNDVYFKRLPQKIVDERLSGGDFIILYHQNSNGDTMVYRIEPSAFEYRASITSNDPNLYHRFVVEMRSFTVAEPKDLSKYPKYIRENGTPMELSTVTERQIYWWSLFYDAVSPSYKDEVEKYHSQYERDVDSVARFIMTEYPKLVKALSELPEGATKTPVQEEMKRLTEQTVQRFEDLRRIAVNGSRVGHQGPFSVLRGLLFKETGKSFYKMITAVKSIEKLRSRDKIIPSESISKPQDKIITTESLEPTMNQVLPVNL